MCNPTLFNTRIEIDIRLTKEEANLILQKFDDSSDTPLHIGLNFDSYSEKLSQFANFILYHQNDKLLGFVAYYLNKEELFIYIPQIIVHKDGRHLGIGHQMLNELQKRKKTYYNCILLEVLKNNENAIMFYKREGFQMIKDNGERWLLRKNLK